MALPSKSVTFCSLSPPRGENKRHPRRGNSVSDCGDFCHGLLEAKKEGEPLCEKDLMDLPPRLRERLLSSPVAYLHETLHARYGILFHRWLKVHEPAQFAEYVRKGCVDGESCERL